MTKLGSGYAAYVICTVLMHGCAQESDDKGADMPPAMMAAPRASRLRCTNGERAVRECSRLGQDDRGDADGHEAARGERRADGGRSEGRRRIGRRRARDHERAVRTMGVADHRGLDARRRTPSAISASAHAEGRRVFQRDSRGQSARHASHRTDGRAGRGHRARRPDRMQQRAQPAGHLRLRRRHQRGVLSRWCRSTAARRPTTAAQPARVQRVGQAAQRHERHRDRQDQSGPDRARR